MKLRVCLCTVVAVASCSASSVPFEVKPVVSSPFLKSKALGLRGGDVLGLPISKEDLAAAFISFIGLNAAVAVPAPEALCKVYNIDTTPGTAQYWILESMSYTVAGIALMSYLATFKGTDAIKTVAYGGVPCAYFAYKEELKGTYEKLGAASGGFVVTAFMLGCLLLIFTGTDDSSLICKIFAAPPVITGVIGCFSPGTAASMWGLDLGKDEKSNIFYRWMSFYLLSWGTLAMALLWGRDWTQAVGLACLIVCAGIAESLFLSKDHKKVGVPTIAPCIVFTLTAIVSAGLLLDSDTLPPFVGV